MCAGYPKRCTMEGHFALLRPGPNPRGPVPPGAPISGINPGTRTHPPSFYSRRSLFPPGDRNFYLSGRHRGSSSQSHRTGQRGSRPSLSGRHRSSPAADEGRRGAPGPGHRGRQGRARDPRHRRQGTHPHGEARPAATGAQGRSRPAPVRAVQPPAGGVDRQALPGVGHAAPRPGPGGQPRPDPRGREVRLAQGLQVLDLRDVVDPPGDPARHRQRRVAPSGCRSTRPTTWPGSRRSAPGSRRASAVRPRSTSWRPSSTSRPSG